MSIKAFAVARAKRVARPLVERARPVLNAGNEERIAAAQANAASVEVLVAELQREVRALTSRVNALEAERES